MADAKALKLRHGGRVSERLMTIERRAKGLLNKCLLIGSG